MASSNNNYRIKLSAIIDEKSLDTQLKNLAGKYSIEVGVKIDTQELSNLKNQINQIKKDIGGGVSGGKAGIDLINTQDAKNDIATLEGLKQKIRDLGIETEKVSRVDIFTNLKTGTQKAVVDYKNSVGEAKKVTLEWGDAADGLGERWIEVRNKATTNIAAVEKVLSSAQAKVDKFGERLKDLGDTQEVMAAKAKAQELQIAIDKGDVAAVQKLSGEFDVLTARVNQAGNSAYSFGKQVGIAIQRTIEWSMAMGLIYGALNQIKQGIGYLTELDKEMTNIQVVTGATNAEIGELATSYNMLAKEMGGTTVEVAQGSLEWIRQGKTSEETAELLRQHGAVT